MRLLGLTLLTAALVGCGFHLRGSGVETNVASAYVRAAPNVTVDSELTRILKQSGVKMLDSEPGAAVVIDLLDQQQTTRTVSYTDRATTAESELDLRVHFKVVAAGGKVLIDDRWVHATRTYLIDTNNLVGSSQQAELLTGEMLTDCAQQIVRGLSAATRVKPV